MTVVEVKDAPRSYGVGPDRGGRLEYGFQLRIWRDVFPFEGYNALTISETPLPVARRAGGFASPCYHGFAFSMV